jgi:hypothetical protein
MARRVLTAAAILLLAPGAALADPPPCPPESFFHAAPGTYWQIVGQAEPRSMSLLLMHMSAAATEGYPAIPWKESDTGGAVPCLRDEFDVGAYHVRVEQYENAGGAAAVRYRFTLSDSTGDAPVYLLLGRASTLNAMAQALDIHPGGVFNLDIVSERNYASMMMFEGEPDYEVVRAFAKSEIARLPPR